MSREIIIIITSRWLTSLATAAGVGFVRFATGQEAEPEWDLVIQARTAAGVGFVRFATGQEAEPEWDLVIQARALHVMQMISSYRLATELGTL